MIHHNSHDPFDARDYETQRISADAPWVESRLDRGITTALVFMVGLLVLVLVLYHGINWILSRFDSSLTISVVENLFGNLT